MYLEELLKLVDGIDSDRVELEEAREFLRLKESQMILMKTRPTAGQNAWRLLGLLTFNANVLPLKLGKQSCW